MMNGNISLCSPSNNNLPELGNDVTYFISSFVSLYKYIFVTKFFPPFCQNTLGGTSVKRRQCASGLASCIFHT